jgi:hypothetical protein
MGGKATLNVGGSAMRCEVLAALVTLFSFRVLAAPAELSGEDRNAIQRYLDVSLHANGVAFRAAGAALAGESEKEVIVYLTDPAFCGSGGCNTLVLRRTPRGFQTVMNATITWPPIRVLETRSHGWRDLGVMVSGGGPMSLYEARLRFDGRHYPSNPTIPPAQPLARVTGEVIIPPEVR